jgi:hypothetical protein
MYDRQYLPRFAIEVFRLVNEKYARHFHFALCELAFVANNQFVDPTLESG